MHRPSPLFRPKSVQAKRKIWILIGIDLHAALERRGAACPAFSRL
jgi:hypothetical protein